MPSCSPPVLDTPKSRDYAARMTPIAYRARALGPLRAIDWAIPPGVSVVVGPNRVGKSTLLRLPELIGDTLSQGLHQAFESVFEGVPSVRNLGMPPSTPMTLGLAVERWAWEVEVTVHAGQIVDLSSERLCEDGKPILWRKLGSKDLEGAGFRFPLPTGLMPSLAVDIVKRMDASVSNGALARIPRAGDPDALQALRKYLPPEAPQVVAEASEALLLMLGRAVDVLSFRTYDYEIRHLLRYGSLCSSALELESTGENVFALLRNWRDSPELEERHEFVLSTMREIFPYVGRFGFEQAGQVITMNVSDRRWPGDSTLPIARESTGFMTALLQLCAVASCERDGIVTLDEIETSLHPRAIRTLGEACRRWAAKHDLRVVLATQSETVLDSSATSPRRCRVRARAGNLSEGAHRPLQPRVPQPVLARRPVRTPRVRRRFRRRAGLLRMVRVQLVTTGVMEERALGKSLRRLFPGHEFVSPPHLDGFTSARLPPTPPLARVPLNLDKLAGTLIGLFFVRATAPAPSRPSRFDSSTDVEAFAVDDPDYLEPAADPKSRWCTKTERQGHPKRYLIYLTEGSGGRPYRESEHGARALEALEWPRVTGRPDHTRYARSLLADLEDMLDPPSRTTAGQTHPLTWPPPRNLVLRNL